MTIPTDTKIESAASKDATKFILAEPYLDMTEKDKPVCVATDGTLLAVVPVKLDKNDKQGYISGVSLASARKASRKLPECTILANGKLDIPMAGTSFTRPQNENYPRWRDVLPHHDFEKDANVIRIAFDLDRLTRLCKAIGNDGTHVELTISVNPETKTTMKPMEVNGSQWAGSFGVLMPRRIS